MTAGSNWFPDDRREPSGQEPRPGDPDGSYDYAGDDYPGGRYGRSEGNGVPEGYGDSGSYGRPGSYGGSGGYGGLGGRGGRRGRASDGACVGAP